MGRSHTLQLIALTIVLLTSSVTSSEESKTRVRRVSNSLADVLGIPDKPASNKRKPPVKITPPLRLKPGETAERPPGWKHCIKYTRATLTWKTIKSPGYPDFLESQIQCSWIIEAPIGMKVKVAFRDLVMVGTTGSCAKQFVQIIDIETGKSQGRFCGKERPGDYVTLGTRARLDLQADKAVTKVRGFLISFIAVKEIPGFRSTNIFPPMQIGGDSGGVAGKVDMKKFLSNNKNSNLPKPAPGSKRASKRLIYESDRNPESTDPSATTTEPGPANTIGGEGDFGWIGPDENIGTGQEPSRGPSSGPLKVQSGNRPRPRPRPTPPPNNGPIIITQSTLPVRILAKRPVTPAKPLVEDVEVQQGPVIYGKDHQPYDPNVYTTLSPARRSDYVDHRPEVLSTTNLIIILACGALFLLVLFAIVLFYWFYRKKKIKKKKRAREDQKKKKQEQENQKREESGMELKVMNLGEGEDNKIEEQKEVDRQHQLPVGRPMVDDLPPGYQPRREYSLPPDGGMEHRESLHGQQFHGPVHTPLRSNEVTRRDEDVRQMPRHEMPSHIQLRHDDIRHQEAMRRDEMYRNEPRRSFHPDPRHQGHSMDYRRRTIDLQEQRGRPIRHSPPSPLRHQTLDPRRLQTQRNLPFDRRYSEYPQRRDELRHTSNMVWDGRDPRMLPTLSRKSLPRTDSRPLPPVPNDVTKNRHHREDADEDYCSDMSDSAENKGQAPMRREYSPWELEQQKRERKKKLINGEI